MKAYGAGDAVRTMPCCANKKQITITVLPGCGLMHPDHLVRRLQRQCAVPFCAAPEFASVLFHSVRALPAMAALCAPAVASMSLAKANRAASCYTLSAALACTHVGPELN